MKMAEIANVILCKLVLLEEDTEEQFPTLLPGPLHSRYLTQVFYGCHNGSLEQLVKAPLI